MNNRFVFFSSILLTIIPLSEVHGQCLQENFAFQAGENISYDVYYNWGFFWLDAGWVDFKVDKATYKNRDVFYFDSYGFSHKGYDWIYKVKDSYEAYLDMNTLQPVWFERKTSEGGYKAHELYQFVHDVNKVFSATETSKRPYKKDTLNLPPCTYDVLSLIYLTRNIDYSGMNINDTIPVTILIDNEFYNIYLRYLGKEVQQTKSGEYFNCLKISSLLVEGSIFKGGENLFVWITDDKNRVPVLVEAKILVGSIKAYLSKAEGLRNKVTSKVKK